MVNVPSIESITGDKLTAYAPNTSGVPYKKFKDMEIIKQLFDLGCLFDQVKTFVEVKDAFIKLADQEIDYRKLADKTYKDVLDDIVATGLLLASRGKQLDDENRDKFMELQQGILKFKNFLISGNFRIDEANVAAAKAAYIAAKIKSDQMQTLERYNDAMDITEYQIEDRKYAQLNKQLKKVPGGALFYWHHALKLLDA